MPLYIVILINLLNNVFFKYIRIKGFEGYFILYIGRGECGSNPGSPELIRSAFITKLLSCRYAASMAIMQIMFPLIIPITCVISCTLD